MGVAVGIGGTTRGRYIFNYELGPRSLGEPIPSAEDVEHPNEVVVYALRSAIESALSMWESELLSPHLPAYIAEKLASYERLLAEKARLR